MNNYTNVHTFIVDFKAENYFSLNLNLISKKITLQVQDHLNTKGGGLFGFLFKFKESGLFYVKIIKLSSLI